jgi:hypothetical protein
MTKSIHVWSKKQTYHVVCNREMGDITKLWLKVYDLVLKYLVKLSGIWSVGGQTQLSRAH